MKTINDALELVENDYTGKNIVVKTSSKSSRHASIHRGKLVGVSRRFNENNPQKEDIVILHFNGGWEVQIIVSKETVHYGASFFHDEIEEDYEDPKVLKEADDVEISILEPSGMDIF